MEDYGLALKKLRKHFSLTQREVAERIGISNHAISKWENGINQPDLSSLRAVCEIYQISIEQFFRIAAGEEVEIVLAPAPTAQAETELPAPQAEQNATLTGAGTRSRQNFWQKNSGVLALVCSVFAIILAAIAFFAFASKGDTPTADSAPESSASGAVGSDFYTVQFKYGFEEPIEITPLIRTKGKAWVLPQPEFIPQGYNFLGWSYKGSKYFSGMSFTYKGEADSCTFTALWEPIRYVLQIYSPLHDDSFAASVTYDEELYIGEMILSYFGYPSEYVFMGFIVNGAQYAPNDILSKLAVMEGETVRVEAVWAVW